MQHDETRKPPFKWARKIDRKIKPNAPLHPSVIERIKAKEVLQYDMYAKYRPKNLEQHEQWPSDKASPPNAAGSF